MPTPSSDIVRLYRREWVIVWSDIRAEGETSADVTRRATEHAIARYDGRVHDEDLRISLHGGGRDTVVYVELFLPNLKGEFKTRALAEAHASNWGHADIVVRNSPEDHELRAYGVKMLPDPR